MAELGEAVFLLILLIVVAVFDNFGISLILF